MKVSKSPKHLYTSLLFLVLFCNSVVATATAIDSLNKKLNTAPEEEKAKILVSLAFEYMYKSSDSTLFYAKEAKKYAVAHNSKKEEGDALILIGRIQRNKGDYSNALKNTIDGLKIFESLNAKESLTAVYNSLGILYKRIKDFDEALKWYIKANVNAKKYNQEKERSLTYNNIGTIYQQKMNFDSTYKYFDSALYYAKKINHSRAIATVLTNYGDLYREQKKYKRALNYFKRTLAYDKINQDKYGLFMSYFQIARVYTDMEQYKIADVYVDSAERFARAEQLKRNLIDLYGWSANVAERRGLYSKALQYYRRSRGIHDTLFTESTQKQFLDLQTKYKTEKKEQQIQLQQEQLSKKNFIIIGVIGLLLLIMLLGYSYYTRYRLRQKERLQKEIIHQQELSTKAVIEAEEKERKRIAGDLHDGVGQTMSAASMNLSVISNEIPFADEQQRIAFEKAKKLVDDGCKEVRTVSHNIMPNALLKSGLTTAIREFLNKIDSKVLKVNIYAEGLNNRLPSNVETVLYRVVQECVNNTIKHAQADTLDLSLIKDKDGISITIEDNGKGFDLKKVEKKDGIGLQNLQTRIAYLDGTIEWDSTIDRGTVVSIHIP